MGTINWITLNPTNGPKGETEVAVNVDNLCAECSCYGQSACFCNSQAKCSINGCGVCSCYGQTSCSCNTQEVCSMNGGCSGEEYICNGVSCSCNNCDSDRDITGEIMRYLYWCGDATAPQGMVNLKNSSPYNVYVWINGSQSAVSRNGQTPFQGTYNNPPTITNAKWNDACSCYSNIITCSSYNAVCSCNGHMPTTCSCNGDTCEVYNQTCESKCYSQSDACQGDKSGCNCNSDICEANAPICTSYCYSDDFSGKNEATLIFKAGNAIRKIKVEKQ